MMHVIPAITKTNDNTRRFHVKDSCFDKVLLENSCMSGVDKSLGDVWLYQIGTDEEIA